MKEATSTNQELKYILALKQCYGLGIVAAKNLIGYCGSAEAVFAEKKYKLEKIPNIGTFRAKAVSDFKDFDQIDEEIKLLETNNIRALIYHQKEYPTRLKQLADAPLVLFHQGEANLNHQRMIAIVGTRLATAYGRDFCKELVADLKPYNPIIVSGLALGIDAIAHQAALDNQLETVAVFGNGFHEIYPASNRNLAHNILANKGAFLTEFNFYTKPDRENFPTRNRIVAGMVDAVIVIETKRNGGSMITANLGFDYDKEVFALPGRFSDPVSSGCNYLIKKQKAHLLETVEDISFQLNWNKDSESQQKQLNFLEFTKQEIEIIQHLRDVGSCSIDNLSIHLNKSQNQVALLLLELEIKGLIRTLPGKIYELK